MPLMFTALSLLGGLMFLALGGNALLRGSAGMAQRIGIPAFLIGLIIFGFGSSSPQLFTAIQATKTGIPTLALASVVGASIFNLFATLGTVALSGGSVHLNYRLWLRGSLALTVIACTIAATLVYYTLLGLPIPRWVGLACLAGLAVYTLAANFYEHAHPMPLPMLKEARKFNSLFLSVLFAVGLFGLILGANLLVDAANQLNATHGLNTTFLGLTFVAIGTALPQLIASFTAYNDKQHALLLNNLVGNIIFNLLGICGLLFTLQPVQFHKGVLLNSFVILAAATVAFLVFTHPAMRRFKRAEAILFLTAYILYIAYTVHVL